MGQPLRSGLPSCIDEMAAGLTMPHVVPRTLNTCLVEVPPAAPAWVARWGGLFTAGSMLPGFDDFNPSTKVRPGHLDEEGAI